MPREASPHATPDPDPPQVLRGRRLLIGTLAVAVLVAGFVVASVVTERPGFCRTCHEMIPYHDAWQAGRHARVSCVECHVDPGVVAHGLHKFIALKEVWDHFTRTNRFPTWSVAIPDSRCRPCHASVEVTGTVSGFSHAFHEERATCAACHPTTGHSVSTATLRAAGILAPGAGAPPVPGRLTPSAIPGHVRVPCTRCHDQRAIPCATCHTKPPHEDRGPCAVCHVPGEKWTFAHPASGDCAACHPPPPNHFRPPCGRCHTTSSPFAATVFRHPAVGEHSYRDFACEKCHPTSYDAVSCTCHGGVAPADD